MNSHRRAQRTQRNSEAPLCSLCPAVANSLHTPENRHSEKAMKILWVKTGKLVPVDTGGKIRSYNILRRLAGRHEVTFLSYYGGRRDEAYEREICEHLPGTKVIYTATRDATTLERNLLYLRRLPLRAPFGVTKFLSREAQRLLSRWLNEGRFDVAVCDFLGSTLNFPWKSATPVALFQHNVESILWRRHAEHEANPIKRITFKLEAAKDRKSTRLNSSHGSISYAVFCLKKKKK